MKNLTRALLVLAFAPACSLIAPLDTAAPDSGGSAAQAGSSPHGGNGGSGGSGQSGTAGDGSGGVPLGGSAGASGSGSGGVPPGGSGGVPPGGSAGMSGSPGTGATGPTCSGTLTPCGGSLLGIWNFKSSCMRPPSPDPTIPSACQGGEAVTLYDITGTINFTASSWTNNVTSNGRETLKYTTACITAFYNLNSANPQPPASATTCSAFATNLLNGGDNTASCPYSATAGGSCNCAVTFGGASTFTDTYVLSSPTSFTNASDPAGWSAENYCVSGNTLTISQTDPNGRLYQNFLTR